MKSFRQMSRSAFTLIELLVVIAIIAILAAILFPVFAKVREKARQTSCQSNEKQISLGILQYLQDNDETMPSGNTATNANFGAGWAGQIYNYVKSQAVFKCPDEVASGNAVSYAYNSYLRGGTPSGTLSQQAAPSTTVLLWEVYGFASTYGLNVGSDEGYVENGSSNTINISPAGDGYNICNTPNGWIAPAKPAGPATNGAAARHAPDVPNAGGAEYAFADGHVKFMRYPMVSSGNTAPNPVGNGALGQNNTFAATFNPNN